MIFYLICVIIHVGLSVDALSVKLEQNGPVVLGGTIQLRATVQPGGWDSVTKKLQFSWKDNAMPSHTATFEGDSPVSLWNVTYNPEYYSPGIYEVQVTVCKVLLVVDFPCTSSRIDIDITGDLNGELVLAQNATIKGNDYVSNMELVGHQVSLKESDMRFLQASNRSTRTYWFLNCTYYGVTPDLKFRYNYTKDADTQVSVRAVVIAGYNNDTDNSTDNFSATSGFPWPDDSCNNSYIPEDPEHLYGYFHHVVKPRRPVQITNVNGTNWLKNGDLLNLTVTCMGSPPYSHCIKFIQGEYNATGNETCKHSVETSTCKINVIHYYAIGEKHTVLFIIGNEVSNTVTGMGITKYVAKTHAPLSVIIVPVSCCVVAVVLIVFGVAYYIQSKNRYTIEVADFDFSANQDMEYKSFRERLGEAMSSAFTRVTPEEGEESPSWSPSRNSSNKGIPFDNSDDLDSASSDH